MTEMPKIGDWVRMSAEGVVISASQFAVRLDNGRYYFWNTEKFNVEVVERTDDPANDPVGTVRRNSGGPPFVKMAPNVWALHEGLGSLESWTDQRVGSYVQERPIIGVVPGTPAAEPAEVKAAKRKPRLFRSGDPEPEDRPTVKSDMDGFTFRHDGGTSAFSWVRSGVSGVQRGHDRWSYYVDRYGPLTEVFEDVE